MPDTDARLPTGMDHAVLTGVDPLVDLAGIAAMAGASVQEVARWSTEDGRFPRPVGQLSGRAVFGYGAACDHVDIRAGRGRSDAQARAEFADGRGDDPVSVMARMARAGRAPLLAGRRSPTFITPRWEPADAHNVLAGGEWVAAVFDEQPDDGDDEPETYQVLTPVALAELMARRDWLMWLTMHLQTMRAMHEAAADLLRRAESVTPARRGKLAGEATVAATALLVMVRALAAATLDKGADPQCPHPHLCEAFAVATIYTGELAALGRG